MVTLEDVRKAADEFAEREYEIGDVDKNPLAKGYYHGSLDRINNAWKSSSEFPDPTKIIIGEYDLSNSNTAIFPRYTLTMSMRFEQQAFKEFFTRWAYIEDLIPIK